MTGWPDRIGWWGLAGIVCYFLAQPLYDLSRAVEGVVVQMDRDCVVGVPEKPEGKGWKLQWVQEKRRIRK